MVFGFQCGIHFNKSYNIQNRGFKRDGAEVGIAKFRLSVSIPLSVLSFDLMASWSSEGSREVARLCFLCRLKFLSSQRFPVLNPWWIRYIGLAFLL
jgi:hypothetical protein